MTAERYLARPPCRVRSGSATPWRQAVAAHGLAVDEAVDLILCHP